LEEKEAALDIALREKNNLENERDQVAYSVAKNQDAPHKLMYVSPPVKATYQ
jgi:hypothetical protein